MKLYLVSNNLLLEGLSYNNGENLDLIRLSRPLSIEGEKIANSLLSKDIFNKVERIYTSLFSSAISTSKYLANRLDLKINLDNRLNECKVGTLGNKNMKMVKGLQDHEFTYKLPDGESLIDVGNRINNVVLEISKENVDTVVFTHKRAILGFLLKYATVGYNLDDNLILEYNSKMIYDDTDTKIDVYEITLEYGEVVNIELKV